MPIRLDPLRDHLDDYSILGSQEYNTVDRWGAGRVLLVGSGPLPMTGIVFQILHSLRAEERHELLGQLLLRRADNASGQQKRRESQSLLTGLSIELTKNSLSVTGLDRSDEACALASALMTQIGLGEQHTFVQAEATDYVPPHHFDVIHIAAMVSEREVVMARCIEWIEHFRRPAHVIVRYVPTGDMREALYRSWTLADISQVLERYDRLKLVALSQPLRHSSVWTGFATFYYEP